MPHIFEVEDASTLYSLIWVELKKHGIKETGRCRKPTKNSVDVTKRNLFGQPLDVLDPDKALIMVETEVENSGDHKICAKGDVMTKVPLFVVQCCQAILKHAHTEGLFRKAGSAARQREIKRQLEKGEGIKASYDVVDLANILKQFLRDLPEPLIPYQYHEILLKCIQMEDSAKSFEAVHLTCLLFPVSSLATLCYLLQFFETIASKSASNLMDVTNLSIVMAPTLMPIHFSSGPKPRTSDRTDRQNCAKLHSYSKIIQLLIRNSTRLCGLPPFLATKLVCISTSSLAGTAGDTAGERGRRLSRDKKRHRRSSSFNRVFEGFKKIVGGRSEMMIASHSASAEQLLDIPVDSTGQQDQPGNSPIIRSHLKRKVDPVELASSLSLKKKKAVTDLLPGGKVLCTTPLTPQGQHVNHTGHLYHFVSPHIDLNPSPSAPATTTGAGGLEISKSGVLRFFQKKKPGNGGDRSRNDELTVKTPKLPKRRLSLGRKSLKKPANHPAKSETVDGGSETDTKVPEPEADVQDPPESTAAAEAEEDYQEVKQHYEELKSHVVALEKELAHAEDMKPAVGTNEATESSQVQNQYEKTLEESERLLLERTASEQLAQQLKRGLRIRRSADQRVIRSPSARKIGAIRRRSSRDSPRPSINQIINSVSPNTRRLTRSQSMLPSSRRSLTLAETRSSPSNRTPTQTTPQSAEGTPTPNQGQELMRSGLRRGQPNTIRTGLKDPTPLRSSRRESLNPRRTHMADETPSRRSADDSGSQEKRAIQRTGSVMKLAQNFATVRTARVKTLVTSDKLPQPSSTSLVTPEQIKWTSAEVFNRQFDHLRAPLTGRPSVQKIRSENIGKVSACVRKFDGLNASPSLPERRSSMTAVNDSSSAQASPCTPTGRTRTPRSSSTSRCITRRQSLGYTHQALSTRNSSPMVSPLRESQKANGAMTSASSAVRPNPDLKIKAPLLTPCHGLATPHTLKLRPHEIRRQKKASPLKAVTTAGNRRSPRLARTPN